MYTTPWHSPSSTISSNSVGNPDNAFVNDDAYAVFNAVNDTATWGAFGNFAIPNGATIVGIEARIKVFSSNGSSPVNTMNFAVYNGSFRTKTLSPNETDNYKTLGGSSDLWGSSWSPSHFADGTFRVRISYSGLATTHSVDHVQIRVHYTLPDNWYNPSWIHRIKVTIDSDLVFEDHLDFPVHVDLADLPAHFHNNVKSDGGDIRVTLADGVYEVPIDLAYYDSGNDEGELHFKYAGVIPSDTDPEFYIYYGNSGASGYAANNTYGANNVWKTGYKMVQHMLQTPTTSQEDATVNNNDLTYQGTWAGGTLIDGQVGKALEFIDENDAFLQAADSNSLDIGGSFTLSCWVYIHETPVGNVPFIIKVGTTGGQHNYYLDIDSSRQLFAGYYNGSTWIETTHATALDLNTLYYLRAVFDTNNDTLTTYINSVEDQQNTGATGTPQTGTGLLEIGEEAGRKLDGWMDEIRIYSGVLSENWGKTEYNNQLDPSTFMSFGDPETTVTISHTTDAYLKAAPTRTHSTDALLKAVDVVLTHSTDSMLYIVGSVDHTTDSFLRATPTRTHTTDSFLKKAGEITHTTDALLRDTGTVTHTTDAYLQPIIGIPTWVSPLNHAVDVLPETALVFTMPSAIYDLHFEIQVDSVDTFDSEDLKTYKSWLDQSGWEYNDGDSWEPMPYTGVPKEYAGNEVRYTPSDLTEGTWYRRVRGRGLKKS